jgi:hypothetical protein
LPNSKGPPSSLVQLSAANIRDDALVTHDPLSDISGLA